MTTYSPTLLEHYMRQPRRYLQYENAVSLTIPSGTPANTEFLLEVIPDTPYWFGIRYFKLTTPLEVQANIKAQHPDAKEDFLLHPHQDENQTDVIYDSSNWGVKELILRKFYLYAVTKVETTADREVILKFCGNYKKKPYR